MGGPTARLFRAALVVKAVDGAAEVLAALVLGLLPSATVHELVAAVLARDLLGPPEGALSRHLLTLSDQFAAGSRTFAVVYLGLHGVVKLALVAALWRRWLPAYPVAAAVLGAFVVYELYRAARTGSVLLPVLAAVDIAIVVVVVREYRLIRGRRGRPAG